MTDEIIDVEIEEERTMPTAIQCPHCDEALKNERGLAIHIGRIHKDVNGKASSNGKTTKTKSTKAKSRSSKTQTVKDISVDSDKINIVTTSGSKITFEIEPPTLLHILASAKAASKEYVESL